MDIKEHIVESVRDHCLTLTERINVWRTEVKNAEYKATGNLSCQIKVTGTDGTLRYFEVRVTEKF